MSQLKTNLKRVAAVGLLLATIALAIVDIYFVREIFFAIFARFSTDGSIAGFLGNLLVVVAAVVAVGFTLASFEYHRKRFLKHESWDLFAWTLVVELAIPFIAIVVLGGSW